MGFEIDRFVNLSHTHTNEFTCGICQDILCSPAVTNCCLQTFCEECIIEWLQTNNSCPYDRSLLTVNNLTRPSRAFTNLLGKLQLKCNFHEIGCQEILLLENLNQHLLSCEYNVNKCDKCLCNAKPAHDCIKSLFELNKSVQQKVDKLKMKYKLLESRALKDNKLFAERVLSLEKELRELKFENSNYIETIRELMNNPIPEHLIVQEEVNIPPFENTYINSEIEYYTLNNPLNSEELFVRRFTELITNREYTVASDYAANAPKSLLKTQLAFHSLNLFQEILRTVPDESVNLAKMLISGKEPLADIYDIIDIFLDTNSVKLCSLFLSDALKHNRQSESDLQTKLLEINLTHDPKNADKLLVDQFVTHYDRDYVSELCEKAGLLERALEHFTNLNDIKRIVVKAKLIDHKWLIIYFSSLSVENSFECLRAMLTNDMTQNMHICVQIAIEYHENLSIKSLIDLFETCQCDDGLYYFLNSIVKLSQDKDVHFKYIQVACDFGQMKEVERVCLESDYYDEERVINYLKRAQLKNQMPLIIVCDRFNLVKDLIKYLYHNNWHKYIEIYVQKVNSMRLPFVIGVLSDLNCSVEEIKQLIQDVRGKFSTHELVEVVEKRNRLKELVQWLEMLVHEDIHRSVEKVYIDSKQFRRQSY